MSGTVIFGSGSVILTPTINGDGTAVAVPTPVRMRECQGISGIDMKFDTKLGYGQGQFPLFVAKGKASCGFAFETLIQSSRQINVAHGQTITTGREVLYEDKTGATIPAVTFQITPTPPGAGTFVADQGVYNGTTGVELTRVAAAPAADQYSLAAGVYTFAAADVGRTVYIDYLYSIATGKKLTLLGQDLGYTPFFSAILSVKYNGDGLLLNFNRVSIKEMSTGTKQDDFEKIKYSADVMADPITKLVGKVSLAD